MDLKCQGLVLVVGLVLGLVATDQGSTESSRLSARSYDYGNALKKAILFFEGQRSGKLPSKQRVEWRGDSALTDGQQDKVINYLACVRGINS